MFFSTGNSLETSKVPFFTSFHIEYKERLSDYEDIKDLLDLKRIIEFFCCP